MIKCSVCGNEIRGAYKHHLDNGDDICANGQCLADYAFEKFTEAEFVEFVKERIGIDAVRTVSCLLEVRNRKAFLLRHMDDFLKWYYSGPFEDKKI